TTNSNLKNNYSTVKVTINGKPIDSGEKFVGCFIGDHAKTGIGTMITTGAMIGVAANVFGGGVTSKVVPSFSWGPKEKYNIDKAVETMRAVVKRRNQTFTEDDEKLIRYLHKHAG
ncbi:MAG: glucose-1-phosphate thymidylyltransferase, partial [bacterium]